MEQENVFSPFCVEAVRSVFGEALQALNEMSDDARECVVRNQLDQLQLFGLLRAAGEGSVDAHRDLAERSVLAAFDSPQDAVETLFEGLTFARLAAVRSGEIRDRQRVAAMLGMIGLFDPRRRGAMASEALAWVNSMADAGHEESATLLASCTQSEPPEVVREAMHLRPFVELLWSSKH